MREMEAFTGIALLSLTSMFTTISLLKSLESEQNKITDEYHDLLPPGLKDNFEPQEMTYTYQPSWFYINVLKIKTLLSIPKTMEETIMMCH